MNEEAEQFLKGRPMRIKLPRKPAAPKHSQAFVKVIPSTNPATPEQTNAIGAMLRLASFPLLQISVACILAAMILDDGECFQMVCYATLAYLAGLLLMVLLRREKLTATDEFLVRWGFPILCVISFFISTVIWSLRGDRA